MWVIVFAQMAAGRDPVLGSGTPSSSAAASKNSRKQPTASRRPRSRLAVDPLTGMIVRVPVGRNTARAGAVTTPAPSLPPVTTSQS